MQNHALIVEFKLSQKLHKNHVKKLYIFLQILKFHSGQYVFIHQKH